MTTPDAASGDRESDWLDEHVELHAVGALTPEESTRVEQELAALPPNKRAVYEACIVDIQAAMAGFATTYALDAPTDLRHRVLTHVFEGASVGIDPRDDQPRDAGVADPLGVMGPDRTGSYDSPSITGGDVPRSAPSETGSGDPGVDESGEHHTQDSGTVARRTLGQRRGQHRSGGSAPRPARATAILAAAAVTVAVALGAGVLIGRTTAPEPSTTTTALSDSQRQVLGVLTAADATVSVEPLAGDRGTISVVTSESANQAIALLRDLRKPIPSESTYQLWLVGGAERPVSAGLIPGDDTAPVVVDDVDGSSVLAVTIEPAGGSEQPTTPILAQVAL
ncbi:anti-sigma factor [Gordonia sp. 'Campus']|uniref:anti-sigma factor n=1 Tax=Gordonia sp. 'Campus' TaxID=2915824 RepID=UPI001EE4AFC9|nr:anti-sigma factor [Gordonia sp. 'Campus']